MPPSSHTRRNKCFAAVLLPPKETSMRIIFVVLIASVLSILGFKYMDRSIGEQQIMATPAEMSASS
jgi:ATP/ADP translocase